MFSTVLPPANQISPSIPGIALMLIWAWFGCRLPTLLVGKPDAAVAAKVAPPSVLT
ncbi:hypothetical protein D3C86_1873700 [compost metagenome]